MSTPKRAPATSFVFPLPGGRAPALAPRPPGLIPGMLRPPVPGAPIDRPNEQGQEVGPPGLGNAPQLIHEPGGNLIRALQPAQFETIEHMFRAAPQEAWFDPNVSPTNPVQFDLGSYQVRKSMSLWLMDYEFSVYRQSGVDPGDILPAEEGRFSGVMGFDISINGRRVSNLLYQLDPHPVVTAQTGFPSGGRATQAQFDSAAFNSFASTSGQGLSLLPVRRARQGVDSTVGPFTLIARPTDVLTLTVVIFRPILSPVTAIQGRFMGYEVPVNISDSLVQRVRPR